MRTYADKKLQPSEVASMYFLVYQLSSQFLNFLVDQKIIETNLVDQKIIWFTKKKFGRQKKILVYKKKYGIPKKEFGRPKKWEIDRTTGIPKRLTNSTWTPLTLLSSKGFVVNAL